MFLWHRFRCQSGSLILGAQAQLLCLHRLLPGYTCGDRSRSLPGCLLPLELGASQFNTALPSGGVSHFSHGAGPADFCTRVKVTRLVLFLEGAVLGAHSLWFFGSVQHYC